MKTKTFLLYDERKSFFLKSGTIFLILLFFMYLSSLSFAGQAQKNNTNQNVSSIDLSSFKLNQNYPNPFNPSTQIKYSIPVETHVELKVYNVLGNEVATLVNEEEPAGEYTVKFSASSLSSGVYIYRLQTDYSTITRKMTLIR